MNMTLFKVWGWILLVSAAITVLIKFAQMFGAKDGDERTSAALGFVVGGMSMWWLWTALQAAR
jgi:hypothetical protein